MKHGTSDSWHAQRARRKRLAYSDCERRPWTQHDEETLRLHIEFFGFKWQTIAASMQRSPDALRNKVMRMAAQQRQREEREARAWLRELVKRLKLKPPSTWTTCKSGAENKAITKSRRRTNATATYTAFKALQCAESHRGCPPPPP